MHTRKRHNELYHELNHSTEFRTTGGQTTDLLMPSPQREKRWSVSSTEGEKNSSSDKSTPDDQHSWDNVRTVTFEPTTDSSDQDKLELSQTWGTASATTPDTSEGDFQTEV
ncbi:adhesion G protein-coupled receptor B2-like [Megalops cyprinoides]|uniref:adhesion G protein-coupled receptor B2-like n=1 Tax=Megalops cyprinoides TaxID=118141 RepID=UPI001864EB5A|nr:adhesion G protein-coupled receptor B2-like [Megalops cyprinoides]XP_036397850.1 adhesion G protein-coupled receptor B2-like [Megalops cyprinoides]